MLNAEALAPWGRVELRGPAGGGSVNEVLYSVVEGTDCVVRRTTRGDAALQWELNLLCDLQANGLAVPEVVPTLAGESRSGEIVVFRRERGVHPAKPEDWELVAQYLDRLHDLGVGRAQRPGFHSAADLMEMEVGGGIDLREMPPSVVSICREAWARLANLPQTVVHGDPGLTNIFVNAQGVVLIDWDEARVDCPWFDLAAMPDEACPLAERDLWIARQAASAWEAAISWQSDRSYAEARLAEVEPL